MLKNHSILFCVLFLYSLSLLSQQKITILHTNDMHSAVLGDDFQSEGVSQFAKVSAIIHGVKDSCDHAVIAVDGGDFLMGTLFQSLEMTTGFQLHLMKQMGYDAVCLGNHEFDYGLDNLQSYLQKAKEQGCPTVLLSNIGKLKNGEEGLFNSFYKNGLVGKYEVIEKDGFRIGLFGILGDNAYDCAPNLYPYELENVVKTARDMVNILKNQKKVDIIICLSHSGVYKDKKGNWENNEDVKLAEKVKGIDVIISGHTHTLLQKPIEINGTSIVQVGTKAKYVGQLDIIYGSTKSISYKLIPVDSCISADSVVNNAVLAQLEVLKDSLKNESGLTYDQPYFRNNFEMSFISGNPQVTNVGDFIADALYYDVNKNSAEGTDIALVGQGTIRSGFKKGTHSLADIFSVASLGYGKDFLPGYPLSRMYFTANEIKKFLELLEIASVNHPMYYCFKSGLRVTVDPDAGKFHKIKKLELFEPGNGYEVIDFSKNNATLYSVTADSYMMSFMSLIQKKSHGLIHITPKNQDGTPVTDFSSTLIDMNQKEPGLQEGRVWKSMIDYAQSFEKKDENGIPVVPDEFRRKM